MLQFLRLEADPLIHSFISGMTLIPFQAELLFKHSNHLETCGELGSIFLVRFLRLQWLFLCCFYRDRVGRHPPVMSSGERTKEAFRPWSYDGEIILIFVSRIGFPRTRTLTLGVWSTGVVDKSVSDSSSEDVGPETLVRCGRTVWWSISVFLLSAPLTWSVALGVLLASLNTCL